MLNITLTDEIMTERFDDMVGFMPVTPMRFFTPNKRFWAYMEKHKALNILELGCGRGDTVVEAKKKGFRWTGFDLNAEIKQILAGVHRFNALRVPLAKGMMQVIARPDHSGWTAVAIKRAYNAGVPTIYISKRENVDRDIPEELFDKDGDIAFAQVDVGDENEIMIFIAPKAE